MRRAVTRPGTSVRAGNSNPSEMQAPQLTQQGPAFKHGANSVQTVLDQQGNGRVIHQPDGSIIWEPFPAGSSKSLAIKAGKKALAMLELMGVVGLAMSGVVAGMSTIQHVDRAYKNGTVLTSGQLTRAVTQTVASTFAGLVTGAALGPVRAATQLARVLVRPAIGGFLIHRGAVCAQRRLAGATCLIRRLQSGDMLKQLEALAAIVTRALTSETFRKDFARASGVDLLLKLVSDALAEATGDIDPSMLPPGTAAAVAANPMLHLLLKALEALMKSQECRDACVRAGGVPVILKVLSSTAAAAATSSSGATPATTTAPVIVPSTPAYLPAMLRSDSNSPTRSQASSDKLSATDGLVPQQQPGIKAVAASSELALTAVACLAHMASEPLGREAIREADGLPVIVDLLVQYPSSTPHTYHTLALLQTLAVDNASKEAIGLAGGVSALFSVIKGARAKSQVKLDAVATLHTLLRGSVSNQLALAQVPGSFNHLRNSHVGLGSAWNCGKANLHALMNILSRFPDDMPCHQADKACTEDVDYELVVA